MGEVRHERELREQWERMHMAVHGQEQLARDKAEAAVNNRLDGMNELRAQINSERGSYATRDYVDTVEGATDKRLKNLEQGKSYVIGWVAAIVLLGNLVVYFLGRK
jgi:hypothetical protein